jgi:hypothetical protein
MKKKLCISVFMFIVGWGIGTLYKPPFQPKEGMISECNWISRYDFFDYEEGVLKEGSMEKLGGIIGECGVDRFPYMIVMYDVYHENVCSYMELFYSLWQKEYHKRNLTADAPIREFVKSVLTEYAEQGDKDGIRKLHKFIEEHDE